MEEQEEPEIPPATVKDFHEIIGNAIEAGNLDKVQSFIRRWQSDTSAPGRTGLDIDSLVTQAAEDGGKSAILEYLLSQGGAISSETIVYAKSPAIFRILIQYGWKPPSNILRWHLCNPTPISLFLSHGVTPKAATEDIASDIEIAALRAPLETIKLLVEHGATPPTRQLRSPRRRTRRRP